MTDGVNTDRITEDEWDSLDYFWSAKGDLERWVGWEKFSAMPKARVIVEAWERYKTAEAAIGILIKGSHP